MKIYKKDFEWKQRTVDRMGKTFSDDLFFYRGIYNYKSQVQRVKRMFTSGLIDLLVEQKFIIPVEMTDLEFADTNEFGLIIRSKKIKNITYPTEWSFSMLFDAAKFVMRLEKVLLQNGYTLNDVHSYNVIFVGTQPYHCDLGSIFVAQDDCSEKYVCDMVEQYYRPLLQWRWKKENIAAKLFLAGTMKIDDREWNQYLFGSILGDKIEHVVDEISGSRGMSFERLERKFTKLENFIRRTEKGHLDWSHYQDEYFSEDGTVNPSERFKTIVQTLKKYKIQEITELAANQGALLQYCMEEDIIKSGMAIDYDEWAVDRMYCRLKGTEIGSRLSVGVVDLVDPKSMDFLVSKNRMANQAVVAMALTHHLILSQGMSVESVIEEICEFAKEYVLIEFMPLGLYTRHLGVPTTKFPLDYSIDNFRETLNKKCEILEEIKLEVNRVLFIAEKRK